MKKLIATALAVLMMAGMMAGCGKSEQVPINSAADLGGKKIGVQAGTTGETWVKDAANVKDGKITSYKSGMDAALQLKNGVLDAVVLDELPSKAIVAEMPELQILDIKFSKEAYAIAIKKGNKELVDAVNATINKTKDDGSYEKFVAAFMPTDGNIIVPSVKSPAGKETIKLGTNAAFKPFEYLDNEAIVGFDITMGEQIALDMGKTLEVKNMDFDSLISALSAGQIDFIAAGMSITPEREKNVDFSVPYYESEQVIIVRK